MANLPVMWFSVSIITTMLSYSGAGLCMWNGFPAFKYEYFTRRMPQIQHLTGIPKKRRIMGPIHRNEN